MVHAKYLMGLKKEGDKKYSWDSGKQHILRASTFTKIFIPKKTLICVRTLVIILF